MIITVGHQLKSANKASGLKQAKCKGAACNKNRLNFQGKLGDKSKTLKSIFLSLYGN